MCRVGALWSGRRGVHPVLDVEEQVSQSVLELCKVRELTGRLCLLVIKSYCLNYAMTLYQKTI